MALITETYLRTQLIRGLPNPFPITDRDMLTPAAADFLKERGIVLQRAASSPTANPCSAAEPVLIPVGVSNRHAHLSPGDVEALFGKGRRLTPLRELSQKGQFAASETVTLQGPKGCIANVRILGPSRGATQVEISRTDGFELGVHPPLRLSGDLAGTPGITLIGPSGSVVVPQGLIVARNHVHASPEDAQRLGLQHGEPIMLQAAGERPVIFGDVTVRVSPQFSLDFHIDRDEANAAMLGTGDMVRLIRRSDNENDDENDAGTHAERRRR
ncbi:phosphate propanoyltransferase [Bacillus sp. 3255]|uniref:phosphate propanoyltransferase n=1 Tax=Bacillus sp. 3255 TaxID=2817904 RepID=UPI00285E2DFC|nr:phosphate propanoyltransferase [Bacillus sp. 3255]MDR6884275.1 putative phosphotransacetylase [Bacillus sp. 3255]